MEPQSSIILESCQEDSMLIETVKNIVTGTASNELESEVDGFFVVTDVQDQQQNAIEIANGSGAIQVQDRLTWPDLCRICANVNDHLIPIFEGEGLQHELCTKIHKYLPIHVSQNDTLPLQLCYHCAATLLAWHELSEGCLNAERRLLEVHNTLQEKRQFFNAASSDGLVTAPQDTASVLNSAESLPHEQGTVKDEDCADVAVNSSDRCKNEIVEARSSSFSNFQKAYKVHLQLYKNQTKVPCASTATRIVNQTEDTLSPIDDIPITRNQLTIHKDNESYNAYTLNNPARQAIEINEIENTNNSGDLTFYPASKTCTTCFQVFDCQNQLEKHITNAHHSETGLKGKQRSVYTAKIRKLEPAKKLTVDSIDCMLCDKKFRSQKTYRVHTRTHTGEKSYTCHICGKQFGQTGSLYYHLKHVHAGIKNHSCEICGRCFAMKSAMLDHRRIHTNERPYVCDSCGKTFRTKASLYIHNKSHTNEYPHKCAHCPKAFRWKQQMLGHLTIHTGEKNHTCDVCGKGFGVRNALTRHKRTHSEEKPYSCEHCGISFGQKRYLKNHERARHK